MANSTNPVNVVEICKVGDPNAKAKVDAKKAQPGVLGVTCTKGAWYALMSHPTGK